MKMQEDREQNAKPTRKQSHEVLLIADMSKV
jgi:hypothetical protein